MVRALASHQCDPGSIPGLGVICGLSLLLVLFFAPRGFSPVTPVFPSPLSLGVICGLSLLLVLFFAPRGFSPGTPVFPSPLSLGVICGLSLLLVLFFAPRGFSPGTPVFPSPRKTKFQIPIRSAISPKHACLV